MYGASVLLFTVLVTSVQGFFFLLEKKQAFYCGKVCPLYCPDLIMDVDKGQKRSRRRAPHYEDYEPDMSYEDFPPYIDAEDFEEYPYHFHPKLHYIHYYHHHKKTTTTTTEAPTTAEPTLICQVCKKKCRDFY